MAVGNEQVVELYAMDGRLLQRDDDCIESCSMGIGGNSAGIYLLRAVSQSGMTEIFKFLDPVRKVCFWIALATIILTLSSCNEDPVEPDIPPAWERFLGRYNVTKLENQQEYELKITVDSSEVEQSGRVIYKLIWENFDDSFDTLIGEFTQSINPDEIDGFNAPHGVSDINSNRWAVWLLPHDESTPEPENTLVNDTILFYFQKSNIAFYFEDGVPFYECECKHLAVKVE